MAYAKVGIYGEAASGKTFTAAKIAIGLHKYANLTKPVAMFDTEPAASFIIPLFEEAGIDFLVYDESRALQDLMKFVDEAEKEASIIIVDSITHIWRDAQDSYLAAVNQKRKARKQPPIYALEFQHWKPIKAAWQAFTDRFLSSQVHFIVCGRAGSIYEYQDKGDGSGKKELITVGTKMATEKELGYEPSLLVEMVKHRNEGRIINRALVEKDRANKINGMEFDKPDFKDFMPHFDFLNIGGQHHGSMNQRDSKEMYDADAEGSGWDQEKRQREIWCEEIQGLLLKHYPSQSADHKASKMDCLESVFDTRSWTKVENMKAKEIESGFKRLKEMLEPKQPENTEVAA